jgi:multidrug efflux system outer membrane protein
VEKVVVKQLYLLLAGLGFILSGCVVGPNYKRPPINAPAAFRGQDAGESTSFADQAWWNVYSDPHLMALIKEAFQNNYDLKTAIAHVEEARAYVGVARSGFYPSVGFETGAQLDHGVYKDEPDLRLSTNSPTRGLFLGGLSTAWEIDLWGRIRRSTEAANARYLGTEQARRGLMLSLLSDVAAAYFELVELDRRLVVARSSRDAFQATDKLFSERFGAGIASKLQVTRAEAALAESEGTISDVEQQIAQKENQICVLVGRNPGPVDRITPQDEMNPPPVVPAGIPSQLLERRPDILEAEQNLRSSSAEIGVATANFFPRIGLTTLYGRVSTDLSSLANGSSAIWALASSLSGPIFTGGQLTNQRRAAVSVFDQAKDQYAQRALGAFREVSDALTASQKLAAVEDHQNREVTALTESVAIANRRYLGGLASYYEVLEAQQLLYPAELALSKTSGARRLAIVELYKALGGGWNLDNTRWIQGQ